MMKNLLFDLDNTIFDFSRAERNALISTFTDLDISYTQDMLSRYSVINTAQWKLLEEKTITRDMIGQRRFGFLFREFCIDADPKTANRIYEGYLGTGHYFIDGAEDMLRSLYGRYRLFIVSNGSIRVQNGRIESSGIKKYFDNIFLSGAIGFDKPDKRFFDECFRMIPDFMAEETAIIGDSLTSDILGGNNAGIASIWFNPGHERIAGPAVPDHIIYKLCEINDYL